MKRYFRLMKPDDEGSTGGGAVDDRGDNWTPTEDEEVVEKKAEDDPDEKKVEGDDKKVDDKKVEGDEKTDDDGKKTDDDTKAKHKDTRIPAARHKEILDKERARREAVEVELSKYRQGGKIADVNAEITEAENTLVGLEQKYAKELVDGKHEEAAATMTKIRRTERAINEKSWQVRETATEARAVETARYDLTVDRLEALYPALNASHDDFDKEKTAEVLEMKEAFQLKGYTPSAALQRAVRYIMPPATAAQEKALDTEPRVDAKEVERARKAAAVDKVLDAAGKTPSDLSKAGKDSDKAGGGAVTAKDIMKMPYADFVKLDEAALARARGDVL